MGYDDFCRCTPREFNAVVENWDRTRQQEFRNGWERTRFLATAILQPYSKKRLRPKDIAVFEWEKAQTHKVEKSTRERMEYVKGLLKKSE